ncbi:hypothetical protein [Endozoicomonas sp. YOMI1]|uniref:hypothetical protein n=1 Tax=Endozoicomonas sp. YOMI1 TaxID=2828739 RepID=UPI0021482113|nr:hypothetical protein [Endozoicomonas sp. YOMI1]
MEINKLFDTEALRDSSYAEFIKCQTVNVLYWQGQGIPMAITEKDLEHMHINYMGAHLELDFAYQNQGGWWILLAVNVIQRWVPGSIVMINI